MASKLILIDGYGFVFRAYHSLPPLTAPDGTPVGAVYGFTNMLFKLLSGHDADKIAVVLDAGEKTFRNDIYKEYKANRPPAPDDLIPQFPLVRKAAESLNLPVLQLKGFEADDLIATYAKLGKEKGSNVKIVSSDKDLMQLVDDKIHMYDPMKARDIGVEQVQEKFGVAPEKVLDVLSLMGDSSDNVPGVPGIGPKTAAELIQTYGNLDTVLERAEEIKQNKRREMLIQHANDARLSRDLIRLDENVPLEIDYESLDVKELDASILVPFLQNMGFKSLINRVEKITGQAVPVELQKSKEAKKTEASYILINNIKNLEQYIKNKKEIPSILINPFFVRKNLTGATLLINTEDVAYIPLVNNVEKKEQAGLFESNDSTEKKGILFDDFIKTLKPWLEDTTIQKILCDAKQFLDIIARHNVNLAPYDDVMLLSYALEAGQHGHSLYDLAVLKDGITKDELKDKALEELSEEERKNLFCKLTEELLVFYDEFKQRIFDESMTTLYQRIEKPLIAVLSSMEVKGIKVDPAVLKSLSDDFEKRMQKLEKEIYLLAGEEFNIGSPKQLGEVLFNKLGLQGGKKSAKTGAFSTGAEVLEGLAAAGHNIAQKVVDWRILSKLKSTYTDALPKQIKQDGRIHTTYAMTVTSTGRLSSNDPNLQNIPIRTEEGNKIRKAFVADTGFKLISADYSQIELRLLAHIADIKVLKDAFRQGNDIHAITASQIYNVPLKEIDQEYRRRAKTINFGIIYGMSAFGLAQRLGIPRSEASEIIKAYFKQYPGIQKYMDEQIAYAREHGYVKTLFGRKCFIKDINAKNPALRQFSERAAINAPLQGTAADIIKKAMIKLHNKLLEQQPNASILLQVHDELVLEAKQEVADSIAAITKQTMENIIELSIPCTVDVGIGHNWQEIH